MAMELFFLPVRESW